MRKRERNRTFDRREERDTTAAGHALAIMCQRHFEVSDVAARENDVACHVERLPSAGAVQPYDFAAGDDALEIANLSIDRKGTVGDWHVIVQWVVNNQSGPRADVFGTDRDSNKAAFGGRRGGFDARE